MSIPYRPYIDGLRAISIVAVILYHYELLNVRGGYLGVDVFFVISGYLISSIILKEHSGNTFSLKVFYIRRIKRIIPPFLFVIITTTGFAIYLLDPLALQEFFNTVLASVFFGSNFLFWLQDGYYAEPSALKPLLHTWSLAVEEQFYIVFPVMFIGCLHYCKKDIWIVFVLLILLSLGLSEYGSRYYSDANYYLLPTRFWELLVGALLSLSSVQQWRNRLQAIEQGMSLLGLGIIIISFFVFTSTTRHPSMYTSLPVIGAALVILFTREQVGVGKFLSNKKLVFIGLISYSLYLWHFVFIALFRNTPSVETLLIKLQLLSLTIVMSLLSFYLIEKPIKGLSQSSLKRVVHGSFGLALIIATFSVMNLRVLDNKISNYEIANLNFNLEVEKDKRFALIKERCRQQQNSCTETLMANKSNILIIGDSMVDDAYNILATIYPDYNYIRSAFGGCPPHPDIVSVLTFDLPDLQECLRLNERRFQELALNDIDGVIINNQLDWFAASDLEHYLDFLGAQNMKNVILFGDYVAFEREFSEILKSYDSNDPELFEKLKQSGEWRSAFNYEGELRQLATDHNFSFISMKEHACVDEECRLFINGYPFTWDNFHFSLEFSEFMAREMTPQLRSTWLEQL